MRYIFLILSLISFSVYSQTGAEAYWRFENNGNDQMARHNLTALDYADYSASEKVEGSYGANLNNWGGNRFVSGNKIDLSSGGFTLNFNIKRYNVANTTVIWTNRATDTGQGLTVYLDCDNGRIAVSMRNGVTEGVAYSANSSVPAATDTWVSVRIINLAAQYATVYINGTLSGNDSTALAGSERNDTVSIGANRAAASFNTLYEYLDNMSLYKWTLTPSQITDVYNNRTTNYTVISGGGSGSTYAGIATYRNGSQVAKYRNGSEVGFVRRIGGTTGDLVEIFKEDFEDWPIDYFDETDLISTWQTVSFEWIDPYNNRIINVSGNKKWEMYYPANYVGAESGFGFGIPLGDELTEVWLQQDVMIGSGFDPYNNNTSAGGGKVLPGLMGGPHTGVPYCIPPAEGDSLTQGWMSHVTFSPLSSTSTVLSAYMYWQNMTDLTEMLPYWGSGVYGTGPYLTGCYSVGSWHTYTIRVKLNDLGSDNGFVEFFWDGAYIARQTGMRFRTNTESSGITKYIDKIFEGFWFGGAGDSYRSQTGSTVQYDNIIAYYYLPTHPDYRSGTSSRGITPLTVTGHKYAADFFPNQTFTTNTGTVKGFENSWLAPAMAEGDYCTKTITVSGASSITLDFSYWKLTHVYTPWPRTMGYVQVRNSANSLVYTFSAQNPPVLPVTVSGETVYLRYFSGMNGIDGGWTCDYTGNF
jgi:hypothetical protein